MSLYSKRGVSAQKEEVHKATRSLDPGLYPASFCKIYPDYLCGDDNWVNIMHADGAGTKSILAYLYWKETGDLSVWKGIAQDAIVMNLDDLLCVGVSTPLLFSSTIDRNMRLIPGEVLETIIEGTRSFFELMHSYGIDIHYLGGETADVGDLVRTITVNGTMTARWPKSKLITNQRIAPGDVIIGLAGFGQTHYEDSYNSGLASNGLTSARHDSLQKTYGARFPESYDSGLEESVVYIGPHQLSDTIRVGEESISVGQLLLSPTRTFAPVLVKMLNEHFSAIHGLVHCSGGGQTKCLKYLPGPMKLVKDNLFTPPPVFELIQQASGADAKEMYQVFNMGTRMEIYTTAEQAAPLLELARSFGVAAQVIGRVESSTTKSLEIITQGQHLHF
ncbi:MAG: phosphoribosylformylglycinamidine cyclo-ligase [Sphingomonadales bacterium]|nr:phosphoribosylformylglycinamidine cyclo-ligase [Sphingomonadales bacterium]